MSSISVSRSRSSSATRSRCACNRRIAASSDLPSSAKPAPPRRSNRIAKSPKWIASTKRPIVRLVRSTWRATPSPAPNTKATATIRAAAKPGVASANASAVSATSNAAIQPIRISVNRGSKPMLLHPAIESGARQAELVRGGGYVVAVLLERFLDQPPLDPVEVEVGLGRGGRGHADHRFIGRQREMLGRKRGVARQDHSALDRVAQRADVAGPIVFDQHSACRRRQRGGRAGVTLRVMRKVMIDQRGNILATFAQRRQVDLDRVEAEQQILA